MSSNITFNPTMIVKVDSIHGERKTNSQSVRGNMDGKQSITSKKNGGHTTGQEGSFIIDRDQTKAGQMIPATALKIKHSEKCVHWKWVKDPRATRFTEVAELLQVRFFYIKASTNFLDLSANTEYGAYLIFKTTEHSEGLDAIMNSSVSVGREQEENYVCLKPTMATAQNVVRPEVRSDGWFELNLGQFYCDSATNKEALVIIKETSHHKKKAGLIVAGVEIRPPVENNLSGLDMYSYGNYPSGSNTYSYGNDLSGSDTYGYG